MKLSFPFRGDSGYRESLLALGLTAKAAELVVRNWPKPVSLMNATDAQLGKLGVTKVQARRLRGAMDLGRLAEQKEHRRRLLTPADVAAVVSPELPWAEQEIFVVLALNSLSELIDGALVGVGDVANVTISARTIFLNAIRAMASSVILVHNHPSGDAEPSELDILLTRRFVSVGHLLGIPVLDHIVIGRGGELCSLAARGQIALAYEPPP